MKFYNCLLFDDTPPAKQSMRLKNVEHIWWEL